MINILGQISISNTAKISPVCTILSGFLPEHLKNYELLHLNVKLYNKSPEGTNKK